MKTSWRASLPIVAIPILALCATVFAAHVIQSGPSVIPPADLQASVTAEAFYASTDGRTTMTVKFLGTATTRAVGVTTIHAKAGSGEITSESQYAVRFWPTAVAALENGVIAVAGVSPRTGNTIIEIWTFTAPNVKQVGVSSAISSVEPGALSSVDEIYDEKTAGRNVVRRVLPQYGGTEKKILAWFDDSRALYSISRDTAKLQLVASPTAVQGAITAPFLTTANHVLRSGHFTTGKYVYIFGPSYGVSMQPPSLVQFLVFYDDDLDGKIDSMQTLDGAQFEQTGFSLSTNWIQ